MVIFYSYVSLLEGTKFLIHRWLGVDSVDTVNIIQLSQHGKDPNMCNLLKVCPHALHFTHVDMLFVKLKYLDIYIYNLQ